MTTFNFAISVAVAMTVLSVGMCAPPNRASGGSDPAAAVRQNEPKTPIETAAEEDPVLAGIMSEIPDEMSGADRTRDRAPVKTDGASRNVAATAVAGSGPDADDDVLDEIFGEVKSEQTANVGPRQRPPSEQDNSSGLPQLPELNVESFGDVISELTGQLSAAGATNQLSGAIQGLKDKFGPSLGTVDFSNFNLQSFINDFMAERGIKAPGASAVNPAEALGLPIADPLSGLNPLEDTSSLADLKAALDAQMAQGLGKFIQNLQPKLKPNQIVSQDQLLQLDSIKNDLLSGQGLNRDAFGAIDFNSMLGSLGGADNPFVKFLTNMFSAYNGGGSTAIDGALNGGALGNLGGQVGAGGVSGGWVDPSLPNLPSLPNIFAPPTTTTTAAPNLGNLLTGNQLGSMLGLMSGSAGAVDFSSILGGANPTNAGGELTDFFSDAIAQGATALGVGAPSNPTVNNNNNAGGLEIRRPGIPESK